MRLRMAGDAIRETRRNCRRKQSSHWTCCRAILDDCCAMGASWQATKVEGKDQSHVRSLGVTRLIEYAGFVVAPAKIESLGVVAICTNHHCKVASSLVT